MKVPVRIKKVREDAVIPTYGSEFAAGADLYACLENSIEIEPGQTAFIPTGIALEVPVDYAGLVYARSGLSCKQGLAPANKVGVIDADYRGEVMVALYNQSQETKTVANHDRVAQLVITPFLTAQFMEVEELEDTVRGEGGFGSTGSNL